MHKYSDVRPLPCCSMVNTNKNISAEKLSLSLLKLDLLSLQILWQDFSFWNVFILFPSCSLDSFLLCSLCFHFFNKYSKSCHFLFPLVVLLHNALAIFPCPCFFFHIFYSSWPAISVSIYRAVCINCILHGSKFVTSVIQTGTTSLLTEHSRAVLSLTIQKRVPVLRSGKDPGWRMYRTDGTLESCSC